MWVRPGNISCESSETAVTHSGQGETDCWKPSRAQSLLLGPLHNWKIYWENGKLRASGPWDPGKEGAVQRWRSRMKISSTMANPVLAKWSHNLRTRSHPWSHMEPLVCCMLRTFARHCQCWRDSSRICHWLGKHRTNSPCDHKLSHNSKPVLRSNPNPLFVPYECDRTAKISAARWFCCRLPAQWTSQTQQVNRAVNLGSRCRTCSNRVHVDTLPQSTWRIHCSKGIRCSCSVASLRGCAHRYSQTSFSAASSHILYVRRREFVSETFQLEVRKLLRAVQARVKPFPRPKTLLDLRNQVTLAVEGGFPEVAIRQQVIDGITTRKVQFNTDIPGRKYPPLFPIILQGNKVAVFIPNLIHDLKWNPQPAVFRKALSKTIIILNTQPRTPQLGLEKIIWIAFVAANSLVLRRQYDIQVRTCCFGHMNMAIQRWVCNFSANLSSGCLLRPGRRRLVWLVACKNGFISRSGCWCYWYKQLLVLFMSFFRTSAASHHRRRLGPWSECRFGKSRALMFHSCRWLVSYSENGFVCLGRTQDKCNADQCAEEQQAETLAIARFHANGPHCWVQ